MDHDRSSGNDHLPPLYGRVFYDLKLESEALERLSELDLAGCRRAFSMLLRRLDFSGIDGDSYPVVQLLVDTLQKVNRRIHRDPDDDGAYQQHRMDLIERFSSCRSAEHARRLFMPALTRLLRPLQPGRPARHPLVDKARRFIEESYSRRISLSAVAESLAISPNYLSRLFRRETGMTLTAYIQRVRLERAKLLLAEETRTISEIAYQVGYQNYRDFYRNFVKYERASPRQLRRQLNGRHCS
jgi:AraC-like DNA-binding protein